MTDGEALAQSLALQESQADLAVSLAALATTEQHLHEAIHELRFVVESHPRSCGCSTCSLIARLTKVPG